MKTISVINQKGGTGKTTTALCLADGLQQLGKSVLLIDLDAQCNASFSLGSSSDETTTSAEVLAGECTAADAIKSSGSGIFYIPGSPALAGLDFLLSGKNREQRLRNALQPIKGRFDFIVIDCPPALGLASINALTASDSIIIPTTADAYALQGLAGLTKTCEAIRASYNPALRIAGILLVKFSTRTVISRDLSQLIDSTAQKAGTQVFNTKIRDCTALREAQAVRTSIYTYAPRSNAAADYSAFTQEILNNLK